MKQIRERETERGNKKQIKSQKDHRNEANQKEKDGKRKQETN